MEEKDSELGWWTVFCTPCRFKHLSYLYGLQYCSIEENHNLWLPYPHSTRVRGGSFCNCNVIDKVHTVVLMLVSVEGGLCSPNIVSLQAVVAVVRRANKTDWQAELSLLELLPARAFLFSISVSFLVPALAHFLFPGIRNQGHAIPHMQCTA